MIFRLSGQSFNRLTNRVNSDTGGSDQTCGGLGANCLNNLDSMCDQSNNFVCNAGSSSCQQPQAVGGPCSEDQDCVSGIFCGSDSICGGMILCLEYAIFSRSAALHCLALRAELASPIARLISVFSTRSERQLCSK